jgi:hypothetical protein
VKKFSRRFRDHIFRLCVVCALAVALTGCSWFHRKPKPASYGTTSAPPTPQIQTPVAPPQTTNQSQLLLATTSVGKVAKVNLQAKFVVLQFPIGQLPPIDTRMVVYHSEAKTGEVKITGPTLDNDLTVADIVLGTVQENDEVRGN